MIANEAQETLLEDADRYEEIFPQEKRIRFFLRLSLVANFFLLAFPTTALFRSFLARNENKGLNWQFKQVDFYTPILDKLDLHPTVQPIQGSLFDTEHSIYRGDPSPAVDAAWERVSGAGSEIVLIHSSNIPKIGKDPNSVVHAPEEWGVGPNAVPVQVDVFHQIHCLNELRKEMHYEHDYGDAPRSRLHVAHKKHCLHILLQNLMCRANVNVITHDWVETTARPYADFNILHQCRDFEALLDWQQRNKLSDVREKFNSLKVPESAVRLPFPIPMVMMNETGM